MNGILRKCLVLCLFAWVTAAPPAHSQEVVDYIVAVVDNDAILFSDVMQALQMYALQTQKNFALMPEAERMGLQKNLLQQMIDARILIATARRDSLGIPVDQIDNAVRQISEQLQAQYGSQEALEQTLAQEGMTIREWHRLLRKQKEEELQQRKLEEQRFGQIRVSGLEVEQFFRANQDSIPNKPVKVTISHIMVSVRPDDEREKELRGRIEEIQRRIAQGENFEDMAKRYSEDLASARNGGDLGFFMRGDFVREFEDAAFALTPGETSDIVRSPYGYHLIRLEEKSGDRIRARHILIQVPTTAEDERRTQETLGFLRQRILNGDENFEAAAKKYSEDLDSSQDGGSLGEFYLEQLQPQYQTVVAGQEVGEISEPIKIEDAGNTYHLLRLEARSGGHKLTLEKDWDDIALLAKQRKWNTERRRWLDDLRMQVYIDERGLDLN